QASRLRLAHLQRVPCTGPPSMRMTGPRAATPLDRREPNFQPAKVGDYSAVALISVHAGQEAHGRYAASTRSSALLPHRVLERPLHLVGPGRIAPAEVQVFGDRVERRPTWSPGYCRRVAGMPRPRKS